jgi:aubergine
MYPQQHKLTIWPGYLTSIRQHEEKLLLGVDLIFKVLRAETALDVFQYVRNRGGDFRVRI